MQQQIVWCSTCKSPAENRGESFFWGGGWLEYFAKIYTPVARTNLARDEATASKENMEKKLEEMLEKLNLAKADLSDSKQEQDIQV